MNLLLLVEVNLTSVDVSFRMLKKSWELFESWRVRVEAALVLLTAADELQQHTSISCLHFASAHAAKTSYQVCKIYNDLMVL